MSELLSGKEAKLAWANGEQLQVVHITLKEWEVLTDNYMLSIFDNDSYIFRRKPRTITLNNIEVPAPFEPSIGDEIFVLCPYYGCGYRHDYYQEERESCTQFGVWRTEEEIKQVVSALRSVFYLRN